MKKKKSTHRLHNVENDIFTYVVDAVDQEVTHLGFSCLQTNEKLVNLQVINK